MPDWIIAVILGIIEGITEFIPVSSTGHLLIAEHWLGHQSDLYNIVIQCGAVVAVIPLFHQRFHQFIFRWREKATQDYLLKIFVAFFITGAIGFVLDKKGLKLPENLLPVAIAVLVGGLAFVGVEYWLRGKKLRDEITWSVAIAVGFGQLLAAVFPGTSRSGATIVLALILGLNRPLATEFSFLVGIPTMLAAGGLKIFKALHHPPPGAHENWNMILLCTVVSAIVSFIAVKWLLRYVQTHTFLLFGWYRIALGVGILILVMASARQPDPSSIQTQQNIQRTQLSASIGRAPE
ncbi:MAG TPA: undecaprenyl-diphosphate phosphatase [Verrucomicrobiae bacterium]|jgi:undecaprenyl-diphosphatase|nr:undecaprenyl-diphosphate phosphatase [Verrucomicrobiae bacterium]